MAKKREHRMLLAPDEKAAKINVGTGEVTEDKRSPNNVPAHMMVFEPKALFRKAYPAGWKFLRLNTNDLQFKAAFCMMLMVQNAGNSLRPLSDDTTQAELSEILSVSKNRIKGVLKKLFELGVYGKFEVVDPTVPYTKYWVFNPFLAFSGKLIEKDVNSLFAGTHIGRAFHDPTYKITKQLRG